MVYQVPSRAAVGNSEKMFLGDLNVIVVGDLEELAVRVSERSGLLGIST